jgi:mono/diheme cytochrome c family protein
VAEAPAAKPAGIERKDYKWNAQDNPEKNKALRLEGNAKAGEADYKAYCEACHLPQGVGNPHGS